MIVSILLFLQIDIVQDDDLNVKCEVRGPGGFHYTSSITIDVISKLVWGLAAFLFEEWRRNSSFS